MGYELNKLMKLYGVSTPGMAPYTGPAGNASALQGYNQYRTDYMNRVAATPMYGEQQYLTGLAGERVAPNYASMISPPTFDSTGKIIDTITGGTKNDTLVGGKTVDTITGGTKNDTIAGGGISTEPGSYEYNYFENTPADLAKIKELQTGPNAKARADLVEMYLTTFNRLPDKPGFEYYLNTIGSDDYISPEEAELFARNAQPELNQYNQLQGLYGKYAGREADIPGLEYWMGEIGRSGGVDPVRDRFLAGVQKEVDMGNAGFRPGMYDVGQMGSRITPEESARLYAAAPFVFGQDPTGAANNRARQQLYDLYTKDLGRTAPDPEGFNWWINKIGSDNIITQEEANQFLAGANQPAAPMGTTPSMAAPTAPAPVSAAPAAIAQPSAAPASAPAAPVSMPGMASAADIANVFSQQLGRQPEAAALAYYSTQPYSKLMSDVLGSSERAAMVGGRQMYHGGAVHDLAQKYKVGGAVRKFEIGGNKGELDESKVTAVRRARGMLDDEGFEAYLRNQEFIGNPAGEMRAAASGPVTRAVPSTEGAVESVSPAAQPVKPPPSVTTPVSPAATDLMAMLANYGDDVYAPELKTARQKVSTENEKFAQMIETAMKSESAVPDKTELYFRLAKAFGSPTKTGALTENLSLVGGEAAEYAKDVRAGQRADKQLRTQLGLEAQKLRAQGAREDLTTLRTLAGEEMKDRRAILTEYIKSGRPQSEAGKAAIDAGLTQGTTEFTKFVEKYIDDKVRTGNMLKEAMVAIAAGQLQLGKQRVDIAKQSEQRQQEAAGKLTPGEVKLKAEAETTLGGIDDAMSSLKRAYSLNPNTFDGTLIALAQRKILEQTDPKDPRVLATREQQNLLSKGAIDKLRASFGGNPTEGERAALLALEGIDSKSKEERAQIMKNTYKLLQARREREQKRLNEISKGAYRETTPAPAAGDLE
jgi:hypothetical protein